LGAVEEVQHGGDLVSEDDEGLAVVLVETQLAELAKAFSELHHGAAVVLLALHVHHHSFLARIRLAVRSTTKVCSNESGPG
jgi:hypothetical protein